MPVIFTRPVVGIGTGDLVASNIDNDSTISGTTVKDALEELAGAVDIMRFKYNQHLSTVSGTKIYSIPHSPVDNTVQVYVNGLLQESGIGNDYTISGQIITFSQNLALDDVLLASYIIT